LISSAGDRRLAAAESRTGALMNLPNMTPKRWFWSLAAFGLLWSFAGWRWGGGEGDHPQGHLLWMASLQNGISQPVETAAIPPTFLLTTVQASVNNLLRPAVAGSAESSDALRQRLRDLENENAQLKGLLDEVNARLEAMRFLHAVRIEPADVLPATVVAYQAGPGSATLALDKGATHGVKPNNAVIAALAQVHLLGRVEEKGLGQLKATVRLITDPTMKISAQIVRPRLQSARAAEPVKNIPITGELCLLTGLGNGQMAIDNIDTTDKITGNPVTPQKGDLVCLTDGTWPAKVQHMVLGQVESVAPRIDQPQRYHIIVAPRLSVSAQRTVMVLVHD
jgi:hypothetical protein